MGLGERTSGNGPPIYWAKDYDLVQSFSPLYTRLVTTLGTTREILKWKKNHQLPIFFYFYTFAEQPLFQSSVYPA